MSNLKELFYNSIGFNTAEIVISANNCKLSLFYYLNDNPVQHIWQEIHKDSNKFTMGVSGGQDIDVFIQELNLLLAKFGQDRITCPVSQNLLNELHHQFVENTKIEFSEERGKINLLIHAIESKSNIFTEYNSTVIFYKDPSPTKIPIKEEYKLWLINDTSKWGHLQLGFGTLGKSWNEISRTNDNLDDLNIQSTINSETVMIFNVEFPCLKIPEKRLYQWAKSSNYNVPLDNLNQLALGQYCLGEIIITDAFLNFHPIVSDWYVPNHHCKLSWGRKVLGVNPQVEQIKFFNSDMYFNTLVNHAGITQYV